MREVHLQHGWSRRVAPDRPWVVLISVPWPRFTQVMGHTGDAPEFTLARYALEYLIDVTMPRFRFVVNANFGAGSTRLSISGRLISLIGR